MAALLLSLAFNHSYIGLSFYNWLNENYTPFQINAYWTWAITSLVHWTAGLLFMALDLVPSLHIIVKRYKIQPDKQVGWKDYSKIISVVARNCICCTLPMSVAMAYWRPLATGAPLPGPLATISTFAFCLLCEEVGFYFVHRAFHSRLLYRRFHLKHHSYGAPVALAGTYCTMTEMVFVSWLDIRHEPS